MLSISNILTGLIPINKKITIKGWVKSRRDSKSGFSFISINDGSSVTSLQIIVYNTISNYKDILHLTTGCSVIIIGYLINSLGKKQKYEIKALNIEIIGWVQNPNTYPLSAKYHTTKYLREISHLRPRTNLIGAITRIRHNVTQAIHTFMNKNNFLWIPTPLITTHDTEKNSKMFRVSTLDLYNIPYTKNHIDYTKDFFCKESFLTVSGQLNAESYACALSKVYTFGPTFRAENSNTTKHLAEFWMIEPEIAFASLNDIICFSEILLKYIFNDILTKNIDDINFLLSQNTQKNNTNHINDILNTKFIQIDYSDAITILNNDKQTKLSKKNISWGSELSTEHEKFLVNNYFCAPVFIKNYPKTLKAFYMRTNTDNITVASVDLLVPKVGEIIGGSQREERLEKLDIRMLDLNLNTKEYEWYRDLRKYGTVPHSGFGLGLERLLLYITGLHNIKDVIPFPRTPGNANF